MPLWLIAIKELRWKQYKWSRTSQDKVGQFLFGRCTWRQSVSTKCHFQQVETVWIQIIRPSSAALQSGWIQEVCDPACMYLLSGVRLALGAVRLRGRNPSISRWNEVCVCVCRWMDGPHSAPRSLFTITEALPKHMLRQNSRSTSAIEMELDWQPPHRRTQAYMYKRIPANK